MQGLDHPLPGKQIFEENKFMVVSLGQLVQNALAIPASPGNLSATVTTFGASLVGIQMPAVLTSTSISFLAAALATPSAPGNPPAPGAFQPLYNKSGLVTYTVVADQFMAINPADFYGVQFFQILMGSTEAAARTLQILLKGM
jgi:hypothetical protein